MLSEHLGTSTLTAGNTRYPIMPIVLKEVVETSEMKITCDEIIANQVLFHLKCGESNTLLPVHGTIIEVGRIAVVHLIILNDHGDSEISLVLGENSEWPDSDTRSHMALAIATVVDQMDQKYYELLSDSAPEEGEDAVARLVFRKLTSREIYAMYGGTGWYS